MKQEKASTEKDRGTALTRVRIPAKAFLFLIRLINYHYEMPEMRTFVEESQLEGIHFRSVKMPKMRLQNDRQVLN
jgi:hypothetical protein